MQGLLNNEREKPAAGIEKKNEHAKIACSLCCFSNFAERQIAVRAAKQQPLVS